MICDSSESMEFCAIFEELNLLEFCNRGNQAWESWNKYIFMHTFLTKKKTLTLVQFNIERLI